MSERFSKIFRDLTWLLREDYESHVAGYSQRFFRRELSINTTVFSTQRDNAALKGVLDRAEIDGLIEPGETDDTDLADLVLTSDGLTDYILAEVSLTLRQDGIDKAARRARVLARATEKGVAAFAIGAGEEPGLHRGEVQVLIIPERQDL